MRLYRYIKRLLRIQPPPTPPQDKFKDLKVNGNLVVGEGCRVEDLSIHLMGKPDSGFLSVEIGADSYLMGSIVLHSKQAKVKIGERVFIGPDTTLFVYDNIEIGNDVMVSWGCTLIDTNAHSLKSAERMNDVLAWKSGPEFKDWSVVVSKPIKVENKSWIGFNSIVLKGVIVGEGSVVGAGSVVTSSTDPYSIVGGNPAVFIKHTS